jgi:hypothetical protein
MSKSSPAFRSRPISPPSGTRPSSRAFTPKAASIGKAILFPQAVEALGDAGNNLSSEVWWSPSHPFKSSLNGLSAGEVAAAYTQATGKQWTQPIGFVHALFELATDVMGRVSDAGDGDAVAEAIAPRTFRPSSARSPLTASWTAAVCRPQHLQDAAGRRPVAAEGRRRLRPRHRRQLRPAVDPDRRHDAADQLIPRLAGLGDTSPGPAFPDPSEQPIQCPFLPSRTYPRALAP